ncbi:MAG: cysteine hydrolase [Burkholderiales bacterium]|nr:cysteine hydrolase [Burkholderiales bacterium]
MKTALLVIDVQHGLCEDQNPPYETQQVIARINAVSAQARSTGMPVIFIQHEDDDLVFGSEAWQLAVGLQTQSGDLFLRKTGSDAFHRTELEQILKQLGVSDLVICGMHTEFCVESTTRRALALGYPVLLVADAHTTQDKPHLSAAQIILHHNATLSNIGSYVPRVRAIGSADLRFGA